MIPPRVQEVLGALVLLLTAYGVLRGLFPRLPRKDEKTNWYEQH